MASVIVSLIVMFGSLCALFGFVTFMNGLCLESRMYVIVGLLMVLIPLIAGCIYVGVAA